MACNYILISVAHLTAGFRVHLVQLCLAYHCCVLLPVSLFSCYCHDVAISNSYHQVACNCTFHSYGLRYRLRSSVRYLLHHHHHYRVSVMELGHLLTRSGLTYPEVPSTVCHDSFCQLSNSVSLPWVIYDEAFYLRVVSIFSCIPVICPKLVLYF